MRFLSAGKQNGSNATLQQYDDFLNFYDIKEGDNMYLAPEDRVTIW